MTHSLTSYDEYLAIAKEKISQKDYSEAEKYLIAALQDDKNGFEALFLIGNLYHDQGKFDRAIVAYKKALLAKPNYTEAAISLSILYNDLGRYEEGRLVFNRAKKQVTSVEDVQDSYINEKIALKHLELAELYETYHRLIDAEEHYQKALKLIPQNPETMVKLARLYEKQGSLNQSVKELKKLKAAQPNYLPGLIKLGLTYYTQGHILEALREWERVLDLDPQNPEALMYLEMAQKAETTTL